MVDLGLQQMLSCETISTLQLFSAAHVLPAMYDIAVLSVQRPLVRG